MKWRAPVSKILISGLINTETTVKIKGFPIEYFPVDYPFFGVNTKVSGVAYNLAKALKTLGDDIDLASMIGNDFAAEYILKEMNDIGVDTKLVDKKLTQTPSSVVLFAPDGRRQIYCDLKDIQETAFDFNDEMYEAADIVVACNINFNRKLLKKVREAGKTIATDVHVLADINDEYNKDFMKYANILFLSDEKVPADYKAFVMDIEEQYGNDIIVLGRGSKGALMYVKAEDEFYELKAVKVGEVVNTVGAGDALFSAFIHYYAKGMNPVEALSRAQVFASYKIGFNGASEGFASERQIEELIK